MFLQYPCSFENPIALGKLKMCGRFLLYTDPETLEVKFHFFLAAVMEKRYNIAPTQDISIIRFNRESGKRELSNVKWGLIPHWAREKSIGSRMINARSETLSEKASFKGAFRYKRCLVPADGFYEWKKTGSQKIPYLITKADNSPFVMAGLWEDWESDKGEIIESATIITCEPNSFMSEIHNRMPVILSNSDIDKWLDPDNTKPVTLNSLLVPCPSDDLKMIRVSKLVNKPSYDTPDCILPEYEELF